MTGIQRTGAVYFAESCGLIKIGYSADPIARSTSITRLGKRPTQVAYNAEVQLIGWVPGDVWRERELHAQHLSSRIRGEWFQLDTDYVRDLIWQDPCGVDLQRMSAAAVFTSLNSVGASRADIEAAGIPVLAQPLGVGPMGAHWLTAGGVAS